MITVLQVMKTANRIDGYLCTDGKDTKVLTKEQLAHAIDHKQVNNATKQTYKGQLIIRVTDANIVVKKRETSKEDYKVHDKQKEVECLRMELKTAKQELNMWKQKYRELKDSMSDRNE